MARVRADLGLDASPAVVTALLEQLASGEPGVTLDGDVLATVEEQADMEDLELDTAAIAKAVREYANAFPGLLGGIYVDRQLGEIVVGLTSDIGRHEGAIRLRLADASRLSVVGVPNSLAKLEAAQKTLTSALPELARQGARISASVLDERENRLIVHAAGDLTSVQAALEAVIPSDTFRVAGPVSAETTGVKSLKSPPLAGGLGIDRTDGEFVYSCTSAFVTVNEIHEFGVVTRRDYFLLTAGHCGNGVWTQALTYPIGSSDQNTFANNSAADAMRIPIRATDESATVWFTTISSQIMSGSQSKLADVVGEAVCVSGARTGDKRCGVLQDRNATVTYQDEGVTLVRQRFASFVSQQGDSGGSVLYGATAMGLLSGGGTYSDGTTFSIYTHIGEALPAVEITAINT